MKNIILILFIALVGCSSSSNDDNIPTNIDENLIGKWSLKNYKEWLSDPYNYSNDEIIWEFKQDGTLTVTVDEQATVHPYMHLQTSGNNTYSTGLWGAENQAKFLLISSIPDTLDYEFNDNGVFIEHYSASDGHVYSFYFEEID